MDNGILNKVLNSPELKNNKFISDSMKDISLPQNDINLIDNSSQQESAPPDTNFLEQSSPQSEKRDDSQNDTNLIDNISQPEPAPPITKFPEQSLPQSKEKAYSQNDTNLIDNTIQPEPAPPITKFPEQSLPQSKEKAYSQNDTNLIDDISQPELASPITNSPEQSSLQPGIKDEYQNEQLSEKDSSDGQEVDGSPSQVNDSGLTTKSRKKQKISDEVRKKIITYHLAKYKPSSIAKETNMNFNSVRSIINVYQKTGRIAAIRGRIVPQKPKLTDDQKNIVKSWLVKDCNLTLTKIKDRIKAEFDVSVSISTCFRATSDLHFSLDDIKEVYKQALKINEKVNSSMSHPR